MKFPSFARLFGKQRSKQKGQRASRLRRERQPLYLEPLESRELLSNDTPVLLGALATPANGSVVTGTANPQLSVTFSEDMIRAEVQNVNNYLLLNSANQSIPINGASYVPDPTQGRFQVVLGYNNGQPLPADRYTLFVKGDKIHDLDDGRPLSQPGQLVVANFNPPGTLLFGQATPQGLISQVNMPGDGSLQAISNYSPLPQQSTSTTSSPVPTVLPSPVAVSLTDMDRDGIADLVVASTFPVATGSTFQSAIPTVSIFRGRGDGSYETTPSKTIQLPSPGFFGFGAIPVPTAMVIGNLDNDPSGTQDIAVTTSATDEVLVFFQDKSGNFSNPSRYSLLSPQNFVANPVGIVAGDFNADGLPDLAVANNSSNNIAILLGQTGGAFRNPTFIATTLTAPTGIAVGDLNVDGRPDLAVSASNGVNYYLDTTPTGSTTPTFMEKVLTFGGTAGTTLATTAVAIGNVDNFGGPDIVATTNVGGAQQTTDQVLVWQGTGTGNFLTAIPFTVGPNPSSFFNPTKGLDSIKLGDVDGDGQNDIIVSSDNGTGFPGNVFVLRNLTGVNGIAQFGPPVKYIVDAQPQDLAIHSTNGKVDAIATANAFANQFFFSTSGDVTVLRAKGDGTFQVSKDTVLPSPTTSQPTYTDMKSADLNNDGLPDVVLLDSTNNLVTVLLNTGAGTYTTTNYTVGKVPQSMTLADLTGTGKQDIIVADFGDDAFSVLSNNGNGTYTVLPEVPIGRSPIALTVGDFNNDGRLDLAVSHQGNLQQGGFGFGAVKPVVTVVFGNGDRTFGNNHDTQITEFGAVALAAADFDLDGNVDIAVVDGQLAGNVEILKGDGTGQFVTSGIFATGENPNHITVGDLNGDGRPDIVVTNQSTPPFFQSVTNTTTTADYLSVLLNTPGQGFSTAIRKDILANTNVSLSGAVITDVNQDNHPDLVVSMGQPFIFFISAFFAFQVGSFNSIATLSGQGDGTFLDPKFYAVNGGTSTSSDNLVAVASNPLLRATQFTIQPGPGGIVQTNLIENGNFDALSLQAEKGNLSGWSFFNERDSRGYWSFQKGQTSPLSGVPVQIPPLEFAAMLDQADLVPFTAVSANGTSADPAGSNFFFGGTGTAFAYPNGPFRQPSDYNGAHALYQDILIPDSASSVQLSLDLYINNTDPQNQFGYSDPSLSPTLNYFPDVANAPANQQVRVDIVDPTAPNAADILDTTTQTTFNHAGSVLLNVFQSRPTTPRIFNYQTITADLTPFRGRVVRLRIGEANNRGKLVVGTANIHVQALFNDSKTPSINGVHLRNPGFGATSTFGGNTTDPTITGRVSDDGSPNNISYIAFDTNNDGDFNGADDFRITPQLPTALDVQGNFQFTVPVNLPGVYNIGIQVADKTGNLTNTVFVFNFQGPSLTSFQAMGPGPIRYVAQGADYQSVSGRITSQALDPRDPSGNTIYVGSVNGGVWRTVDGGHNWTPLTSFLKDTSNNAIPTAIGALAVDPNDPNTIYAATGIADNAPDSHQGVGILKSVDNGQTWTLLANGQFNGARFSRITVVKKNNPSDPNEPVRIYAAAASGPSGPGVFLSTDGGQTWTNVLNPAAMSRDLDWYPNGTAPTLGAGFALASVTDLQVDPFNNEILWAGLGNIGLLPASDSGGVWRSNNGGQSWSQLLGGHDPHVGIRVDNQFIPPMLNATTHAPPPAKHGAAPDGTIVGRVTIALPTGRISDELTTYFLIGNATPLGSFTDGGSIGPGGQRSFGLYKTRNGGLSFTHVMLREIRPINGKLYNFIDIGLMGDEGAEASAMVVDPNDAAVVYIGGSTRFLNINDTATRGSASSNGVGPGTDHPTHGLIRVDTSNMRDTEYVSPPQFYNGLVVSPNDGDDIIKAATAAEQVGGTPPFREPGTYPAGSGGGGYEGEGVFWYDLQTEDYGAEFFSLTRNFTPRLHLPGTVHALSFDPQGRLLVGTEGGIFRGVNQGFVYDITSGGGGIMAAISTTPTIPTGNSLVTFKSYATPDEPGMIFTDLNGNLQISSQTSVAIDAYDRNVIHSSQYSTGFAQSNGHLPQSLGWTSTNVTTASGGGGFLNNQVIDNFVFDAPYAGQVRTGPADPSAPPGITSNVYRTRQLEVFPPGFILNTNRFQVEVSRLGGLPGTFGNGLKGLNIDALSFGNNSPLTVSPHRISLNGVPQDELLVTTDRAFESDNSAQTWDQASQALFANDPVTAVAFSPTVQDAFYVGTRSGKVYVDLHDGADGFPNRSNGLPGTSVFGLAVDPRDATGMTFYAATGGFNTGSGHVWKTTDGGLTWTSISTGLPDFPAYSMAIDPRKSSASANGFLYVGTEVGVYFSIDNGTNWSRLGVVTNSDGTTTATLPNVPVRDIQFSQDFEELALATLGQGTFVISTDRIGPHVDTFSPGNPAPAGISAFFITFNEPIDPRTFTLSQILSFTGPNGPVTALSVDDIDKANHRTFRITFPKQLSDGIYTIVLKPQMTDFVGNLLDENQNGIGGEVPDDQVTLTFAVNGTDNGHFTTGLYHDLLLRPADTSGFLAFLGPVDQARATALFNMALTVVASDEVRTDFVAGLYSSSDAVGSRSPLLPLGNLLKRPAISTEKAAWLSALQQGATPEQVIDTIVAAPEYFQRAGATDNAFVASVYVDLLGRGADVAGATFHLGVLSNAEVNGRFQVALVVTTSLEYRQNLVTGHYFSLLGRAPSVTELGVWVNLMAQGATDEQVIAQLIGSEEYFKNHGSDVNNWLNGAYQDILFRGPDPSGTQFLIGLLNSGASRATVAYQLLVTDEYRARLATGYFGRYLHRALSATDVGVFVSEMRVGFPDEAILSQIVASSEYFQNHFTGANGVVATQLPQQDDNWVRSTFLDVLGRPATDNEAGGFEGSILLLYEQAGRMTVAQTFTDSSEYRARLVSIVYGTYLGRTPSTGEINLWSPVLRLPGAAGFANADEYFLASVLGSKEYLSKQREPDPLNPSTTIATNKQWVQSLFTNVIKRAPSAGEVSALLTTVLNSYQPQRQAVATIILTSDEYRQTVIKGFYTTYLRRAASAAEITTWLTAFKAGARDEEIIAQIVSSDEYYQNPTLGASDKSRWLNQVYRDLLGRDRDAGSQIFLDQLNAATPSQLPSVRLQIATQILASTEYFQRLVGGVGTGFYSKYLRRIPSSAEVAFWVTQLQGRRLTDEDVIAQFVASSEYFLESHVFP